MEKVCQSEINRYICDIIRFFMGLRLRRHIAVLSLLLFIFAMGVRVAQSYVECPCSHSHHSHSHECCGCVEHVEECRNHTQQFKTRCVRADLYDTEVEGVVSNDSKSRCLQFDALVSYYEQPLLLCFEVVSPYLSWCYTLYDKYFGSIKSLRAPPVLS